MSTLELRPERRSGLPRPWRRHHVDDDLAPLLGDVPEAAPARRHRLHRAGVRGRPRGARRAGAPVGRALHRAPARRRDDPRRARARRRHDRRPRCCTTRSRTPRSRSTTSRSSSGPRSPRIVDGVTKLDRLQFDSREAQQAATLAQDARGDGEGHPRPARSSSRTGSTTCARSRSLPGGEAAADRARRRSTSTRRSRTGSASPT